MPAGYRILPPVLVLLLVLVPFAAHGYVSTVEPTIVDPAEWSRYEVVRAPAGVVIDGAISEKEWGGAPLVAGFTDALQPERSTKQPTTAKLMWDDRYLYIAFDCADSDIWSTITKHDGPLCTEDVVEVFVDPEGQGRHYWEIEVSPRNVVTDLMIPRGGAQGWSGNLLRYDVMGILTGVGVIGTLDNRADRDERWSVEMAIPWSDFAGRRVNVPPRDGDSWRLNLFRIDHPGPTEAEAQYLSWSKSPGVFHEPRNFGVVTFRR